MDSDDSHYGLACADAVTTRNGFSRTIIPFPEGEYMRRWIFQCRWFTIRLHKTQLPDEYRPHNHPWSFVSIQLSRNGYTELIYTEEPSRYRSQRVVSSRRFWPRFRSKDTFHRVLPNVPEGNYINHPPPAWTLVLTGPKRESEPGVAKWGFLAEDGSVVEWRMADEGYPTPSVASLQRTGRTYDV